MDGRTSVDGLTELTSGIGGVYLSGGSPVPGELIRDLEQAKALAQEVGGEVPFEPPGADFTVAGSGMARYRFCLKHQFGQIGVTESTALPPMWVQVRASYLHAVGHKAAVEWFSDLVGHMLGRTPRWKVSRLDLFSDVQGWDLTADDRDRFVCRPKDLVTHESDGVFTGFQFGRRKSGTFSARVYDKTIEMARGTHDWWFEKWGSRFRPGERVLRVEFEIRRQALSQFELMYCDETFDAVDRMWAYCTDRWLTYRNRSGDLTRSRWPLAPEWACIRSSELRGTAIGLDRVYARSAAGSLRQIMGGLRGYVASAGAFTGAESLEDAADAVLRLLRADEEASGVSFAGRLDDKRRKLRSA